MMPEEAVKFRGKINEEKEITPKKEDTGNWSFEINVGILAGLLR